MDQVAQPMERLATLRAALDNLLGELFLEGFLIDGDDDEAQAALVDRFMAVLAPAGWQPTPDAVNALPEPIRAYVHALETRADPAGEVRELVIAREIIAALEAERDHWKAQAFRPLGDNHHNASVCPFCSHGARAEPASGLCDSPEHDGHISKPATDPNLVQDAARWRSLLASARIRVLGGARLGTPDALLGLEFYRTFHEHTDDSRSRADLVRYVAESGIWRIRAELL